MCKLMTDYGEKCRDAGIAEGIAEEKANTIIRAYNNGIKDINMLASISNSSLEYVKKVLSGHWAVLSQKDPIMRLRCGGYVVHHAVFLCF